MNWSRPPAVATYEGRVETVTRSRPLASAWREKISQPTSTSNGCTASSHASSSASKT
ncbi:hypothetical protein [Lentzea flaviverrucosa]|uniref:hypothetical protein n=1 Tax=Lentzea flaviverrucosa TaxID=200379 RepID=UPI0014769DF1|nr:hypothetical protein [Lentzea flaviverrucosa]